MEDDSPQIKAIRARYQSSLKEKAEFVEQYSAELSDVDSENYQENLAFFRAELHKLAGSSGMYGYKDVCDLSRRAMSCIDNDELTELQSINAQLHKLLKSYGKG